MSSNNNNSTDIPGESSVAAGAQSVPEPLLDIEDIQGNILAGFNKDHQMLIALRLRAIPAARQWLRRIVPEISSTAEVHRFNKLFSQLRARRGGDPPGLAATWANIAFSHNGLAALTSAAEADAIPSGDSNPFKQGLSAERAAALGDSPAPGETNPTAHWVVGGTGRVPDILLIVASDSPAYLADAVRRLCPVPADGDEAPEVIWEELGQTLPDLPGHEHFGFKDGVSQPGIRGLVSQQPDVYLTPRLLATPEPGELESGRPGQSLIWPGQFVFGYPSTDGSSSSTGGPVPPPNLTPPWIKNGSLLVFRRLRQDVAGFRFFVRENAERLSGSDGFPGMTPERLGALLVGRWASGAPVSRTPSSDLPELADDGLSNNDFLFVTDTPPPVFRPGSHATPGAFPRAQSDELGFICPHAAHIRKMNPRDQSSDLGDQFDTLTRRILRRGIPYGPPPADPAADDGVDRGLHFLCYQTSIEQQFEILQIDWANSSFNPQPGGHDLIIGQTGDGARHFDLFTPEGAEAHLSATRQWVTTTGGGYFFAPSISALRDVLALGAEPA
jgi:Dyp-type peroxidase family